MPIYKLMIVDDSNVIRNKIERDVRDCPQIEVVAMAESTLEAIEKFEQHRPNLITMDITMPGSNGLECIKRIVALDDTVQILVISALSDEYTGLLALQHGANGFLCKPFSKQHLVSALNVMLNLEA